MLIGFNKNFPNYRPFKLYVSGTPFDVSPDLLEVVTVLYQKDWDDPNHHLYACRPKVIEDLGKDFKKLANTKGELDKSQMWHMNNICDMFSEILPKLMLRRRENARWFGHEILDLSTLT